MQSTLVFNEKATWRPAMRSSLAVAGSGGQDGGGDEGGGRERWERRVRRVRRGVRWRWRWGAGAGGAALVHP